MRTAHIIAGVTAALLATAATGRANLIVNGGFEDPVIAGSYQTFGLNSTDITGWLVTDSDVDISHEITPYAGSQFLALDGGEPGAIAQSFATTAGMQYTLSFYYTYQPLIGLTSADANVAVNGSASLLDVDFNSQSPASWALFTQNFVADSNTTTLTFTSLDAPGFPTGLVGMAIDEVSVAPVPEPATIGLAAVSGLLLLVRRRSD